MELLITICARGGSKGIPGKNIRLLNGLPLISYTIKHAQKFAEGKNAVIGLSTDSEEIKKVAAEHGLLSAYERPASLATDKAGKIETIKDLLEFEEKQRNIKFDYVLDLDVTSPLRTSSDLQEGFQLLVEDKKALNLFSVNPASRNPYFNMVEQNENGYFGLVKKGEFLTRQSAPKVFELNASFYFYRREFFEQQALTTITSNSLVYVMPHICFDLDHEIDFEFLEYQLTNNKISFF